MDIVKEKFIIYFNTLIYLLFYVIYIIIKIEYYTTINRYSKLNYLLIIKSTYLLNSIIP